MTQTTHMTHMTPRVWYVVAGGMIVISCAIALTAVAQFDSTIEDMRRFAMPGKAELVLPEGPTTVFVERRSNVDGKAYLAPEGLTYSCALTDPAGRDVPIERLRSRDSYSFGDYEGHAAYNIQARTAGTYVLSCEAAAPFAVAVGYGVAVWHVVALVGGIVPATGGVILFLIVLLRRTRQKRRAAAGRSGS